MNKKCNTLTHLRLIKHCNEYPELQPEDLFKYIYQSSFGCEHLLSDLNTARERIESEYASVNGTAKSKVERLDGDYSRVYLGTLGEGLGANTLAKLFCLSAKKEEDGDERFREKISALRELSESGELPTDKSELEYKLSQWQKNGFPAVHHSDKFRAEYRPAYRVIANKYADFIDVFAKIDALLSKGRAIVAIEGGSASGKTTLSKVLEEVYECNVFHMDDFFLRPEQRTPERFAEVGGNVDRERFAEEVLLPLSRNEEVRYRPFDCSRLELGEAVTVAPKKLTVIEGVYSTHPAFDKYYDIAFFLDISPDLQRERILKRNAMPFANRFFEEWIPLENRYFEKTEIKSRLENVITVAKGTF